VCVSDITRDMERTPQKDAILSLTAPSLLLIITRHSLNLDEDDVLDIPA
jgi:hypothetical protein